MKKRVVVTGIGIVSPMGNSVEDFWAGCLNGTNIVGSIPDFWRQFHDYKSSYWVELKLPDYKGLGFSSFQCARADPAALNSIVAVIEAFNDSNIELESLGKQGFQASQYQSEDVGVYVGTSVGGIASFIKSHTHHSKASVSRQLECVRENLVGQDTDILESSLDMMVHGKKFNPFIASMYMPNSSAANLGIHFNATGDCNNYSYACASSTISIGAAYEAIAAGRVKCAIAGGTEFMGDPYGAIFRAFDQAGTLTTHKGSSAECSRPFDEDRSGFLYSEGAACFFIMEELESAVARNAPMYSEITGFARTFEAYSMMAMKPRGDSIVKMLRSLLENAGIEEATVDYVNAHGTGTKVNDDIESQAISKLFGKSVAVNSSKSLLGHSLGASGALEAAVTALSIKRNQLHASQNIDSPVNDLDYVLDVRDAEVDCAISQSFAFGGHNAALLFSAVS